MNKTVNYLNYFYEQLADKINEERSGLPIT